MASLQPPDFSKLIARIAVQLRRQQLPFMLVGGQAVLLHGRPRLTEDIDITLGVGPDELPALREAGDRIGLRELPTDVERFVRETFVLPMMDPESQIRVDFIFSTTPYEHQAIERAQTVTLGGESVSFATPEDLIIHKLFAGRPRDKEDVIGVVRRKGAELDWTYLQRWADEFSNVPGRENMRDQVSELQREV